MIRHLKRLLATAALACTTACAGAATCNKPAYPPKSLQQSEEGVCLLGFLIRTDGTVGSALVLSSSGSADLDQAALDTLSQCRFDPAAKDGQPLQMWIAVTYVWALNSDLDLKQAKQEVEYAARRKNPAARYQLSLMLQATETTATTDEERERAATLLRGAAELGLAHAQYALGRDLELGMQGNRKDPETAMAWYRKAAAQGDPFALQRVDKDILSN